MKHNDNFITVDQDQACIIAGGRSAEFAEFVKMLGIGCGMIAKLLWKAFISSNDVEYYNYSVQG